MYYRSVLRKENLLTWLKCQSISSVGLEHEMYQKCYLIQGKKERRNVAKNP